MNQISNTSDFNLYLLITLANIRIIFIIANFYSFIMTKFGKNIKKIRSIQKLSQTKFAELFDLSRASVGAYEEGRAEAKLDVISKIAKYFSITVDDLINKEITVNELYHFNIFDTNIGNKINIGSEVLKNIAFTNIPLIISHDLISNPIANCISKAENHITLPDYSEKHLAIVIDTDVFTHKPNYLSQNDIIICYSDFSIDKETNIGEKMWLIKTNNKLYIGEVKSPKRNEFIFFPEDGAPISISHNEIEYILPIDTCISRSPSQQSSYIDKIRKLELQVNDIYNRL